MTTTVCRSCTADVTNGLALCAACQRTLITALVNVAAFYTDALRITPGQRIQVRGAYQSTPPPGTEPARDIVSETADYVSTIVYGWVRCLTDDRPGIDTAPATTELRCGWLEHHVPSILTLEWAGEILREMRDCERRLQRLLDKADTGMFAGICGNEVGRYTTEDGEVETLTCPRNLYRTKSATWVACPECGRTWDADERRTAMMNQARDEHAPVSTIARAVVGLLDTEVSVERLANRIDQWVKRERLTSMGVRVLADGKPHRVYRIGDVFDLLGMEKPQPEPEAC